jgi:ABC-2 type transport system permease protein
MKPTLLRLMHWEWRRLCVERTNLLLLGVWVGLLAVAGWQGASMTGARHTEIEAARSSAGARWQERRARLVEIEAGRAEPEQFGDPRSPTSSVLNSTSDQPVALIPAPLAAMAAGAGEMAPAVKWSGMLTRIHIPADNLENPANRLAGRFDLLFVVSALLPLFVLAFAFDVLARERELRIWPLLASQPINPGWLVAGRLGLHFVLLWLPLAIVAPAAAFAAMPVSAPLLLTVAELACWLLLAAAYLLFWQALAAWINFRELSAAGNALALCGAWLVFVLLIPALVQVAVRATAPTPDRLGLVLAQRDVDIDLHKRADTLRDEFYARYNYELPKGKLNEYDTFFVGNILPRFFAVDEALSSVFDEVDRRRQVQSRRTGQLAWLSPAIAFRRASEHLAGVSPIQQGVLIQQARAYQKQWRAHFGAKLASMTPLTMQDYDTKPAPPVVQVPFAGRLHSALPAIVAVILAGGISLGWAVATARKSRASA